MKKLPQGYFVAAVIVIVALIALAASWFSRFIPQAGTTSAGISCPNCNVIIIGVDTLRADHVHAMGYDRDTTPTIDSLAQKGFLFTQAISPASWTVPAFMSVFTGMFPSAHKVVNKFTVFTATEQTLSNLKQLSPKVKTLAEVMRAAGYATGGFTGDAGVSAKFGYDQGFDVYTDEQAFGGFARSDAHALSWLDGLPKGQKFFMFFHGYDLHGQFAIPSDYTSIYAPMGYAGPYKGTPQEEELLRGQILTPQGITLTPADVEFWKAWYDGKIRDADQKIGAFVGELDTRGLLDNTIIVVLSDHGEEYYEHGGIDHGHSLYDELVHVPLIFVVPGFSGGKNIPAQVTTLDVMPTLVELLGIPLEPSVVTQLTGRTSLIPYFKDPNAKGYDVFTETDYRAFTHKRSIRTADGWKYILTLESGKEELYDLKADPTEENNRIAEDVTVANKLRAKLRGHVENDLGSSLSAPVTVGCLPVYPGECQ